MNFLINLIGFTLLIISFVALFIIVLNMLFYFMGLKPNNKLFRQLTKLFF